MAVHQHNSCVCITDEMRADQVVRRDQWIAVWKNSRADKISVRGRRNERGWQRDRRIDQVVEIDQE
jgi:hypothetical protein